jgi:hypothetical protein
MSISFYLIIVVCLYSEKPERQDMKIKKMKHPPVIDGIVNHSEWLEAVYVGNFQLFSSQRNNASEPSEKTEAWLGYDADGHGN